MKERMTISIDKDLYDALQDMPRKVSISEVITWMLKGMFNDIKAGRELTSEELKEWLESTPEGKDFRERLQEHWGPGLKKLSNVIDTVEGKMSLKKKAKK
jgi:predicted CopG family antitoxin